MSRIDGVMHMYLRGHLSAVVLRPGLEKKKTGQLLTVDSQRVPVG